MKLNRVFTFAVFCLCVLSMNAQNTGTLKPDPNTAEGLSALMQAQKNPHALVYAKALKLRDFHTAITALHYLLIEDPANHILRDSMAVLYYQVGNIGAALSWCDEILENDPNNSFILQLAGNICQRQSIYPEAIRHYERLQEIHGGNYFRYQVASLQFQLERFGECTANVESMLMDSSVDEEEIHIDWDEGGGDVLMRAALLNLRGNLQISLNKENAARKSFRAALKLSPHFILPRNNLTALRDKQNSQFEDYDH